MNKKIGISLLSLLFIIFLSLPLTQGAIVGNTDIEAFPQLIFNQFLRVFKVSINESATIEKVSFYTTGNAGVNISACLYDDLSDSPNNLLASSFASSEATGWTNFTFNEIVSSGDYWIAIGSSTNDVVSGVRNTTEESGIAGFVTYTWDSFPDPFGTLTAENYLWSVFLTYSPYIAPTATPTATPIPQDMATSAIMSTIILVILVITNIIFLGVVRSVMVRFLFALLTFMIGIASLTISQVTFNPYLQMVTVVMSLLCMVLAAKAKG